MREPLVFDTSALLALFAGRAGAVDFWALADAGQITLIFPAAAVAEANVALRASYDAWTPLLYAEGVSVAPLDSSAAVESGQQCRGSIPVAHVVRETRAVGGAVVTARPQTYAGAKVLLTVLEEG